MADINKFTTKEVLNKVLLDSSGNSVAAFSHTTQEALNAVLDSTNSRLNVSLVGGTISGDVTISGDLTVEGDGVLTISETIQGKLKVVEGAGSLPSGIDTTTGDLIIAQNNNDTSDISAIYAIAGNAGSSHFVFGDADSKNPGRVSYDHSDDSMDLVTNSTVRMIIDSSGKISVGSSVPTEQFHIFQGADNQGLKITGYDDRNDKHAELYITSGGDLDITASGHISINGGGNLYLYDYVLVQDRVTKTGAGTLQFGGTYDVDLHFLGTGDATVMAIDNGNKRVGINQNSPSNQLHITHSDNSSYGLYVEHSASEYSGLAKFYTNSSNNTARSLVEIHNDNSSSTAIIPLKLTQDADGTALQIVGGDVHISSSTASDPILKLENTGDNANAGQLIFLTSGAANNNDDSGVIRFKGMNDAGTPEEIEYATIYVNHDDVSDGTEDATMHFRTQSNGSLASRMKISSGAVKLGGASSEDVQFAGADGFPDMTLTGGQARILYHTSAGNFENGILFDDGVIKFMRETSTTNFSLVLDADSRISLSNNAGGNNNTVFGKLAGLDLTTDGHYNSFFGEQAGTNSTHTEYNTAIGYVALHGSDGTAQTGDSNTAIGALSMFSITDGGNNVAVGVRALDALTAGSFNVAIGVDALGADDTTTGSTAIGAYALATQNGNGKNVSIGYQSTLRNATGEKNVLVGYEAGLGAVSGNWTKNVGVGHQALYSLSSGGDNVALGDSAGFSITTGGGNIAIGSSAGDAITTDSRVVAIGKGAYSSVSTTNAHDNSGADERGSGNIAIGYNSMTSVSDINSLRNTMIGFETMSQCGAANPSDNTGIGYRALYNINNNSADFNTAVGASALLDNTSGSGNTAVGHDALENNTAAECVGIGKGAGQTNTSGINNTFVGTDADSSGNFNYQTALGWNATTSSSYEVAIGMNGIKKFKTARVTINDYTPSSWVNDQAATTALFSIPQYSHISKVWCKLIQKSAGTALYNIAMGTASDEAVGDTVAGRQELLGLHSGVGTIVRTQNSQTAHTDILASTGDTEGIVWISSINVETDNSPGWCDSDMYVYVCCVSTNNETSDPGQSVILDIGFEYY